LAKLIILWHCISVLVILVRADNKVQSG